MEKETLKKVMGENIRRERISRNLSIEELSELLEKTTGFIGLLERGHRGVTAYNCYRLSEIFNITLDELFSKSNVIELREKREDPIRVKRMKINSLIFDFSESELDFFITMIKEMKKVNSSARHISDNDDEDEYDDED